MAWFRRHDPRLDQVAGQMAELDQRMAASAAENAALLARLTALESKPLPAPAPPPDTDDLAAKVRALLGDPPPAIDPRRIAELEAGQELLQLRIAEMAAILTNQFSELSGELDAVEQATRLRLEDLQQQLAANPAPAAPTTNGYHDTDLEELRANQVRIANELARFSIAVREEMAALAPRVTPKR